MKFYLLLFLISFFLASFTPILAAPYETSLEKRDGKCPSLDEIITFLEEKGIGGDTVFYTYPGTDSQASKFARAQCGKDFTYFMSDIKWANWFKDCARDSTARNKLFRETSRAMGMKATGTAFLVIPQGREPQKNSIWMEVEYPELKKRKIGVIGVTPDDSKDANDWNWWEYDSAEESKRR